MLQGNRASQDVFKLPDGMQHFDSYFEMGRDQIIKMEKLAFEHGLYFDSYLIIQPDREYLWSSDGQCVVGFSRAGKYLHIAGGLIGEEGTKSQMVKELVHFAQLNRVTITFFHLNDQELPLLKEHGFQVSKYGLESRLSLSNHSWSGKAFQWVRRQSNYVSRNNIQFEEFENEHSTEAERSELIAKLQEISDQHLSEKSQRDNIPFFEGSVSWLWQGDDRRRIFIARNMNHSGRIEAFVSCNPMESGTKWAIEIYQKRSDAVKGIIPYLIQQTIDCLKEEGCEEVSICPIPAVGCEEKLEGESRVVRLCLRAWRKMGYAIYDIHGLYHFKSRFRPDFQDMFIAAYPKSTIRGIIAFMKFVGIFNVSFSSLAKKVTQWTPHRRTLNKRNSASPK